MRRLSLSIALLALLAMSGCGGSGYQVATVKGKVTCKGQPVKGGSITFSPKSDEKTPGKAAEGRLDENGEFVLSTYGKKDGAVVGKHRVVIAFDDPYTKQPCSVPPDLTVEVKGGEENHFDIELSSKK
jgi:hypothetical protein